MNKYLLLILLADGLIWLRSSLGKFPPEKFIGGLSGILTKFASNNPYSWYKDFLQGTVIPNAGIFGLLTFLSELLAALLLVGGLFYLLFNPKGYKAVRLVLFVGLLIAVFLNATFWLAAGWTSPSTDSLNLLMLVVQVAGLAYIMQVAES